MISGVMNETFSTDSSSSPAESISRRAYELWEQEGRPEGSDLRHWLQAEREMSERRPTSAGADGQTSASNEARQQVSDSRPLQGTRAGAAAGREGKRGSSRSPFSNERMNTAPAAPGGTSSGTAKPETPARRRG
jgi:hypothetical protein